MPDASPDRGISEVLSYAFVFGLVLSSIVVVSTLGVAGLQDARSAEQAQNAEKAFDVLDANMAELYYEESPSRATEMELGESELLTGDYVTVDIARERTGGWDNDTYQIRPLVQRLDDERRMIYEAGAVFRTNRQSGLTVHDPPVVSSDRNVHVTVPVVDSPSVQSVGSGTALVRAEVTGREVLVSDTDGTYDRLVVTVTSPRATQWGEALEEKGFSCSTTGSDTVECERGSFDRLYVTVHEIELTLVR